MTLITKILVISSACLQLISCSAVVRLPESKPYIEVDDYNHSFSNDRLAIYTPDICIGIKNLTDKMLVSAGPLIFPIFPLFNTHNENWYSIYIVFSLPENTSSAISFDPSKVVLQLDDEEKLTPFKIVMTRAKGKRGKTLGYIPIVKGPYIDTTLMGDDINKIIEISSLEYRFHMSFERPADLSRMSRLYINGLYKDKNIIHFPVIQFKKNEDEYLFLPPLDMSHDWGDEEKFTSCAMS